MTLDIATIINGGALLVLAWFARTAISAKQDLNDYKLHVAETYLKKGGLDEVRSEVKEIRGLVFSIAGKLGVQIKTGGE